LCPGHRFDERQSEPAARLVPTGLLAAPEPFEGAPKQLLRKAWPIVDHVQFDELTIGAHTERDRPIPVVLASQAMVGVVQSA
jgi:hypothetical protein